MSENARIHVYLSGRVQGVGMRATVTDLALARGIAGWVRNLSDGRVEILAEGAKPTLEAWLAALERQMGRNIEEMQKAYEPADGSLKGFRITH
ncbi:MAG: acylphosphatase [Planctomycetota bacterium]|nr:acylphosphatase [Planctomycetota bacterium]